MQQPADIGRKLLRFGPRQQHTEIKRMQKPPLAHPAFLNDQDAVHDGDLPGGSPETEQGDAHPDADGLAQRYAVTHRGFTPCATTASSSAPIRRTGPEASDALS